MRVDVSTKRELLKFLSGIASRGAGEVYKVLLLEGGVVTLPSSIAGILIKAIFSVCKRFTKTGERTPER